MSAIKQAIYRIISDLIKSDDVITVAELEGLDNAVRQFGINGSDKEEAFAMTLEDAFSCVASQGRKMQQDIHDAMYSIAVKDNECCRAEAFFLVAMDLLLAGKNVKINSYPMKNRALLGSQLVYLEDRKSIPGRALLDESFDEISNLVKLAGMDLIYIPRIARKFREYGDESSLKKLLSLVSPHSDDGDLDNTISAVKGMTTRFFLENVVRGRLDMPLEMDAPVWVLRIADSSVSGLGYINFLIIEVENDIRRQLLSLASGLNGYQASYTVKVNDGKTGPGHFLYGGFYKALLDLMSVKKIDKWDLHFRLYGDGVDMFRYLDSDGSSKKCTVTLKRGSEEYALPLTGRDAAFYLLLLCASANPDEGGMNFHDDAKARITQVRYAQLFRALSRRAEEPLVWDPVFRVPMRSRVTAAINGSPVTDASLQSLYAPSDKSRGFLSVAIEPDRVYIHSTTGSAPLMQSALYRQYLRPSED